MKRALLLGYFGARNWGDELILRSFLRAHRDILSTAGIALAVTMRQPPEKIYRQELQDIYPKLGFVPISPFLPYSPALGSYNFLICPGGSLLQNATSNRSLQFYLAVIGRFAGKRKALLINQGIGPITGDAMVKATRRVISKAALFTARDDDTLAWVKDAVPEDRLLLSSDAVFSCDQDFTPKGDVRQRNVFVFVLREGVAVEAMEFTLGSVPRTHEVYLVGLQQADMHFLRDLRVRTKFPHERVDVLGATDFAKRLPGCALVISERYHGLIAALIAGVPFVGIGDDPKIQSFCREAGMPAFVRDALHEASADELMGRAQAAFDPARFAKLLAEYRSRQAVQKRMLADIFSAP
jgi:polysaccharide pyruvyl transferase CsaB